MPVYFIITLDKIRSSDTGRVMNVMVCPGRQNLVRGSLPFQQQRVQSLLDTRNHEVQ